MAFNFNFGQALSGFSDVIVEKVKAEEAQALADESWDKRFQKQQDAIDKRTRGDKRRATEAEAAKLAESLALHYTPDQVTSIMSKGNAAGKYAVTYAEGLDAQGLDASTAYTMPKSKVQSKYTFDINDPRGSQQSPAIAAKEAASVIEDIKLEESQPFTSRFTKPTKKKQSKANTYQARLLELELQMSNAGDKDELALLQTDWDAIFESYTKYSNVKDSKGKTTAYDWSSGKVEKIINTNLKNTLNFQTFVTVDRETQRQVIKAGNDGNVFNLQLKSIARMRDTYASDDTDKSKTFSPLLDAEEKRIMSDVNSLRRRRGDLVPKNSNGEISSYEPVSIGGIRGATHYPMNPTAPLSKSDIKENISRYKNNDTVQYKDEKGVIRIAIINDFGVIF